MKLFGKRFGVWGLALAAILLHAAFAAAATLTVQTLTEQAPVAKLANQVVCTSGGDAVPNDGNVFLLVSNGDASSHSVSVTPSLTTLNVPGIGQITKATVTAAIGAGDEALLGPFPPAVFNNASGQIAITYTAVTSMKIMAVRISRTQ